MSALVARGANAVPRLPHAVGRAQVQGGVVQNTLASAGRAGTLGGGGRGLLLAEVCGLLPGECIAGERHLLIAAEVRDAVSRFGFRVDLQHPCVGLGRAAVLVAAADIACFACSGKKKGIW